MNKALDEQYPEGWDTTNLSEGRCKHFMQSDPMLARIGRYFPDNRDEYAATIYGTANRMFECLIHHLPTWMLKACFQKEFKGATIDQTIRFLKADVARRREEQFSKGSE